MKKEDWIKITRPDGQKLLLNKYQIVYAMRDPIDETGQKTEIMTNQGSFQVRVPFEKVADIILSDKLGDL